MWRSRDGITRKCLRWSDKSRNNETLRLFWWSDPPPWLHPSLRGGIAGILGGPSSMIMWNETTFQRRPWSHPWIPESCLHNDDNPKRPHVPKYPPSMGGARDSYIKLRTKMESSLSELPLSFLILIFKPSSSTIYPLSSADSRIWLWSSYKWTYF